MGDSVCIVRSFSKPAETSSREVIPRRVLMESVSFGRFASESLQWERWSAFTQNRYLEEVERFTKPGSVAEKKAFFEAHFKNRASSLNTTKKKKKIEVVNAVKTSDEDALCEVWKEKENLVVSEVRHGEVGSVVKEFDSMAVLEEVDLDKENSTSLSKERRPSSSRSKTFCRSSNPEPSFSLGLDMPLKKARKEPLSTRKRSTTVSKNQSRSPPQPFHISIHCAPSGNAHKKILENSSRSSTNVKAAGKADKKVRSGPSSVHMPLNSATSARQTATTAPKQLAKRSTTQETYSKGNKPTVALKSRKRPLSKAAKEDSAAPKCSTRASAFRLPGLPPPRPPDEKRKNITVSSSVSCRIPNNVQTQPSASCANLSTQSRTRGKSFTVSSPFNFRSDERAEKRKEFFKKLEEKKKKEQ